METRFHGPFAYVTVELLDDNELSLMRLRYAGSARTWGFAIYRASHDDYEDSILPDGSPPGTPSAPLATEAGLYLGQRTI